MPIKLITERDLIRGIAKHWRDSYYQNGRWSYGADKQVIHSQLSALNPETATVKEVEAVIGNSSWTRLNCSCCDRACESVVRVGDEPDFESETADLCLSCVGDAVKAFAGR